MARVTVEDCVDKIAVVNAQIGSNGTVRLLWVLGDGIGRTCPGRHIGLFTKPPVSLRRRVLHSVV